VSKPERARELVLAVEAAGGRAVALHADSADAAALERAIDEGAQTLGGLDVLVNNAGILIAGPVDTCSLEDFDKMLANANPQKRVADPDEIARFITYLARPESTYINGASLTIDGGFSA